MTVAGFIRKIGTLDEKSIRAIAVSSVIDNSEVVISDAIASNAEGLTFAGNKIADTPPFTDWEETGEFHDNLKFESQNDISFTSYGEGAEAVFSSFPDVDTIAPTAKILSESAKKDIKVSFIKRLKL